MKMKLFKSTVVFSSRLSRYRGRPKARRAMLHTSAFVLLIGALDVGAEQGALELMPRIAAGKPLVVELRNLSKLPVTISSANLAFQAGTSGAAPCTVTLPESISLEAAEMKTIVLAPFEDVTRCIPGGGAPSAASANLSVSTSRPTVGAQPYPARTTLHPADLTYEVRVGGHVVKETTTWKFAVH
jgi:hypothetical protein